MDFGGRWWTPLPSFQGARIETRAAYRHAVSAGYRFYSFGDAMLVL